MYFSVHYSPNCVLSLHTEQKSRGKVLICENAGNKGGVIDILDEIVAMDIADEPPDDGKNQPGHEEAGDKCKEGVAPLHVNHCGENILQAEQGITYLGV